MPKELTIAAALARMPQGHYDGEFVAPFMLKSKCPNPHRPEGYITDTRFFAEDFGAALAEALGNGWALKADDPGNFPSESAQIIKGQARITIRTKGFGAGAYSKISLSSWVKRQHDNRSENGPEIQVSAAKDIATIARDVTRRILPALAEAEVKASEASAKVKAERDAVTAKLAKLQKAYPDLKLKVSDDLTEIRLDTKYGSKIDLSGARVYQIGLFQPWKLVCGTGHGRICIDDIDSAHGRAFLKLVND